MIKSSNIAFEIDAVREHIVSCCVHAARLNAALGLLMTFSPCNLHK